MSGYRLNLTHRGSALWEIRDNPKPDYLRVRSHAWVEWHGLRDLAYFIVGKAKFAVTS